MGEASRRIPQEVIGRAVHAPDLRRQAGQAELVRVCVGVWVCEHVCVDGWVCVCVCLCLCVCVPARVAEIYRHTHMHTHTHTHKHTHTHTRTRTHRYSCEGLTEYLRTVDPTADRFKACMPCAKKLLNEVRDCIADEKRGSEHLCHSGLGIHTARLKYIRSSEAACNVYMMTQLGLSTRA